MNKQERITALFGALLASLVSLGFASIQGQDPFLLIVFILILAGCYSYETDNKPRSKTADPEPEFNFKQHFDLTNIPPTPQNWHIWKKAFRIGYNKGVKKKERNEKCN